MKRPSRRQWLGYTLLLLVLIAVGIYLTRLSRSKRPVPTVSPPVAMGRPQDPKRPYPYREEQVRVPGPMAGLSLAGTLTLPRDGGPCPAVVLIAGTGASDRDYSSAGHRPFLVLADYLTRQGIAVLRFDKRGVAQSGGDFSQAMQSDFANDVLALVAYLRTRQEIDPNQIGLIGHSEGGLVALRANAASPHFAFLVLLASPGIYLEDVVSQQQRAAAPTNGINPRLLAKWLKISHGYFEIVETENDPTRVEQSIRQLWHDRVDPLTEEERQTLGITDESLPVMLARAQEPGFVSAVRANPRSLLAKAKCPLLALNGDKDVQVPADQSLAAIRTVLAATDNERSKVMLLPGLNHMFQHSATGQVSEYGDIEETFDPAALTLISDWIQQTLSAIPPAGS